MLDSGIGKGARKFFLAGIGAAAMTVEKSEEILEELVKKGELTVEQGKALNEELRHTVRKHAEKAADTTEETDAEEDIRTFVDGLSAEEVKRLREHLNTIKDE